MRALLAILFVFPFLQACSWLGLEDWNDAPPPTPVKEEDKIPGVHGFPYEQMAPDAPPPSRPEFKGSAPGNIADEYVWRDGHWEFRDGQGFIWKSGYWLRKPAFSASWKPDMWMQRSYGWVFVPGYWE